MGGQLCRECYVPQCCIGPCTIIMEARGEVVVHCSYCTLCLAGRLMRKDVKIHGKSVSVSYSMVGMCDLHCLCKLHVWLACVTFTVSVSYSMVGMCDLYCLCKLQYGWHV